MSRRLRGTRERSNELITLSNAFYGAIWAGFSIFASHAVRFPLLFCFSLYTHTFYMYRLCNATSAMRRSSVCNIYFTSIIFWRLSSCETQSVFEKQKNNKKIILHAPYRIYMTLYRFFFFLRSVYLVLRMGLRVLSLNKLWLILLLIGTVCWWSIYFVYSVEFVGGGCNVFDSK